MIGYAVVYVVFLVCTIWELKHEASDTEGRESGPLALPIHRRTLDPEGGITVRRIFIVLLLVAFAVVPATAAAAPTITRATRGEAEALLTGSALTALDEAIDHETAAPPFAAQTVEELSASWGVTPTALEGIVGSPTPASGLAFLDEADGLAVLPGGVIAHRTVEAPHKEPEPEPLPEPHPEGGSTGASTASSAGSSTTSSTNQPDAVAGGSTPANAPSVPAVRYRVLGRQAKGRYVVWKVYVPGPGKLLVGRKVVRRVGKAGNVTIRLRRGAKLRFVRS
jgi:hypothetical protein